MQRRVSSFEDIRFVSLGCMYFDCRLCLLDVFDMIIYEIKGYRYLGASAHSERQ